MLCLALILSLSLVFWGYGGNDAASPHGTDEPASKQAEIQIPDTPAGVLTAFLAAYQRDTEDEVAQFAIGADTLVQDVDDLIARLHYDAASAEKIRAALCGFAFEVLEVVEETEHTAEIQLKIDGHQVNKAAYDDVRQWLIPADPSSAPLTLQSEEFLPFAEEYVVYGKKEWAFWQVDLKNEENKPLVNTLASYFCGRIPHAFESKMARRARIRRQLAPGIAESRTGGKGRTRPTGSFM